MKNLLNVFFLMLLIRFISPVQAQSTAQSRSTNSTIKSKGMAQDCVMMKDGKMMMMKDGKMMAMTEDMTMSDGSMCMKDGTHMKKDGTKMAMKEGQCVMMDGRMTTMEKLMKEGKMKSGHKMGKEKS